MRARESKLNRAATIPSPVDAGHRRRNRVARLRTVKIQGGLGNQLFGIAFARSVALATQAPVALDVASFGGYRYGHRFMVGDLADRIGGLPIVRRSLLGHRLTSAVMRRARLAPPGYVAEPATLANDFDLSSFAHRKGYFDGYWQDETYVLDASTLGGWVRDFVRARSGGRPTPGAAVIHYRTYREEDHPRYSRTPEQQYFRDSVAAVEQVCGGLSEILLVSDDPDLALARLGDLGCPVIPVVDQGWAGDLQLMLSARALILSNSSFSWWGGFCGVADIVTYPARGQLYHYPMPARRFLTL